MPLNAATACGPELFDQRSKPLGDFVQRRFQRYFFKASIGFPAQRMVQPLGTVMGFVQRQAFYACIAAGERIGPVAVDGGNPAFIVQR